jgi:hypothetical protein
MSEEDSPYCKECGSCGEDGCCSALKCAYNNMVKKSTGLYCEHNFKELEFSYKLSDALYEKYEDKEIFDKIFNEVYS